MMKVLQVLYPGLGGQANVSFSLTEGDVAKENKYSFIFYGIENIKKEYADKCRNAGYDFHEIKKRAGLDAGSVIKYIRYLRYEQPEIVLLHSVNLIIPSLWYRMFNKTRLIVVEHDPNSIKTILQRISSFVSLLFADNVVYLTSSYMEEIRKQMPFPLPLKKITVIPNGVNTSVFYPIDTNDAAPQVTYIGMASRITEQKDHATLIRALKIITKEKGYNGMRCLIAGEGVYLNELKKLATELEIGENVDFMNYLQERELNVFYNRLDIYVHTSLSETLSTSILQAMACRKTIVATDIEGIRNLIEDEKDGCLFEAKCAVQLADIIVSLVEDPPKRVRLAEEAYRKVLYKYTCTTMFNHYRELFALNNIKG